MDNVQMHLCFMSSIELNAASLKFSIWSLLRATFQIGALITLDGQIYSLRMGTNR